MRLSQRLLGVRAGEQQRLRVGGREDAPRPRSRGAASAVGVRDADRTHGLPQLRQGTYLEELSDAAIDVVVEHLPRKSSPLSVMLFYRLDAAYSQVAEEATAFSGGRSPRHEVFIVAVCPTPELLVRNRAWVRSFWNGLRPHSPQFGTYVNSLTDADEDRVRLAYGPEKYDRLGPDQLDLRSKQRLSSQRQHQARLKLVTGWEYRRGVETLGRYSRSRCTVRTSRAGVSRPARRGRPARPAPRRAPAATAGAGPTRPRSAQGGSGARSPRPGRAP